jgi:hypothetical protein
MTPRIAFPGRTHHWVVPLGTNLKNGLKTKNSQIIFWAFFIKCLHNYNFLFFHVYQFHALIYGLKFISEF